MRLSLLGVSRAIGSKHLLSDVSLEVADGGFCVLIGPTGCGKTTLLRVVDLLDRPTSGKVFLDGVDCSGHRGRARTSVRRRMSMVMQRPFMLAGTVEKNVRYGLEVRGLDPGKDVIARILASTGLEGMEHRVARTLSGGEMQKVAIARAVITRPELLLLDEPLNSVDQGFRPELRSLIRRLHREMDMTVLMATHDLTDALSLSSRAVVLSEGRVMQAGETGDLFSHPAGVFVASFIGMKNLIPVEFEGTNANAGGLVIVVGESHTGRGYVSVPPEVISLSQGKPESSQRNVFPAVVTEVGIGPMSDSVHLLSEGVAMEASVTRESTVRLGLEPGCSVWISFKATSVKVIT
jgi:tungstate transport system ATP-binding protein